MEALGQKGSIPVYTLSLKFPVQEILPKVKEEIAFSFLLN
jgi:hypothetical protein